MENYNLMYRMGEHLIAVYREGYMSACAELSFMENDTLFFNRLYVHPKLRHRGIAKRLMNMICDKVDVEQLNIVNYINSYGDLDEKDLIAFYSKFGFVLTDNGSYIRSYVVSSEKK